jgi:ribosome biogenesis GTPase
MVRDSTARPMKSRVHSFHQMSGRRKNTRGHDVTERYLAGDDLDGDALEQGQRFSNRSKNAEQEKILKTAALRAGSEEIDALPAGQVVQVHSLFYEVEHEGAIWLCVARKTLNKVSGTSIVVGDRVRLLASGTKDELGRPEAVIEQILPRDTILTRADSFKQREQHPIVANADQMLIVASLLQPRVKWGLVDRMIIAAQSGKLQPIVCLNKVDLGTLQAGPEGPDALREADDVLAHYQSLGIRTLRTSIESETSLTELRSALQSRATVLAGHSGVGKSSLINAIQPTLDIRIGDVSDATEKGRHTTTSARRYALDFGGAVIDTPGVKVFGLWGVTRENLEEFFPDVASKSAPPWRVESFKRIAQSMTR